MKIVIAQMNPRIGDLEGNYQQAVGVMNMMSWVDNCKDADLVVFPELAVTGYPPKDLLEKPAFIKAVQYYSAKWAMLSHRSRLRARPKNPAGILFGTVVPNKQSGKPLQNVAMLADNGLIEVDGRTNIQAKTLLPTYDVFDEARYFQPAELNMTMLFRGKRLGVSICEDIWNDKDFWKEHLYPVDPIKNLVADGAEILINLSASPFAVGKPIIREGMLSHVAKKYAKPLIYVNQVGGNDDVIYDGQSLAFDATGTLTYVCPAFEAGTYSVMGKDGSMRGEGFPYPCPGPISHSENSDYESEQIYKALVLGTRDYARKTGFKKSVIGLSGGIDSAIVAVIAADAFGKENVLGVGMPSKYSSDGSVQDAKGIAEKLGIDFTIIPIKPAHDAYIGMLAHRLGTDLNVKPWEENIQARARGATLMAISNEENRLLLTTGNKSEVAVGYCTLYGDTCGGLAVISDVFKTKVYQISKWLNKVREKEIIPESSISKPPSAELRPNQKDQDSLPPYPLLDYILHLYIERSMEIDEIMAESEHYEGQMPAPLNRDLVAEIIRKTDRNEYKRKQLAPGLKITHKAFGIGRQMPIAQGWHYQQTKRSRNAR